MRLILFSFRLTLFILITTVPKKYDSMSNRLFVSDKIKVLLILISIVINKILMYDMYILYVCCLKDVV